MLFVVLSFAANVSAQNILTAAECDSLSSVLSRILEREVPKCSTKVRSVRFVRGRLVIGMSVTMSYYPFREDNVRAIYDSVRAVLPAKYRRSKIELRSDGRAVEDFIPLAYRSSRRGYKCFVNRSRVPLVTPLSRAYAPSAGLSGRHIALWQSHGRYFDQNENMWRWQRPALWQTREDLFTRSFVIPYLVPMLENAGANVLLPCERDFGSVEIIVDNDGGGRYCESNGACAWREGGTGFARKREYYLDGDNPFTEGTYRIAATVADGAESSAVWGADIPRRGEYAVYVSYAAVENGCDDAVYTVRHLGGESRFRVNQTIGGGTWIYLGRFMLDEGRRDTIVVLSNRSSKGGRMVTADAVKIGGGYGNIARTVCDSLRADGVDYEPTVSGCTRFCEGARYWLQWAGFSPEVYNRQRSGDDYKDDYMCRAHWVNALAGGSERLPDEAGLGIPVDMALAFHTDGGVTDDDRTVGTLGIFFTGDNGGKFDGGASRYVSRDLTDIVMTQIVSDIRAEYEPTWRRRGLWNRSYYEARVPCVPTMLLELLSHCNFADMRYGADPRFRFTVSRAIYKAILKHISAQYGTLCKVAPLPVDRFSAELCGGDSVLLRWHPVKDRLEPAADADRYVIYTRTGNGGFDNGRVVSDTSCYVRQSAGKIYSYRITALNDGGESFPSETLAVCKVPEERGRVLIINGFDRISAPASFRRDSLEGFDNGRDGGAAYIRDMSFTGEQRVFETAQRRNPDEAEMLGASYGDYDGRVVGGNTFDYPFIHGSSLAAAGYSFCSSSAGAVENGDVSLSAYPAIDLIAGKQRAVTVGRGVAGYDFRIFPSALRRALRDFAARGGAMFVSGSYVVSDPCDRNVYDEETENFVRDVLHCESGGKAYVRRGEVVGMQSRARIGGRYLFSTVPTEECYGVEAPDALRACGEGAFAVMRYAENNRVAGVAFSGDYRCVVAGFPFECIGSGRERDELMLRIAEFLFRQGGTDYMNR